MFNTVSRFIITIALGTAVLLALATAAGMSNPSGSFPSLLDGFKQ